MFDTYKYFSKLNITDLRFDTDLGDEYAYKLSINLRDVLSGSKTNCTHP